METPTVSRATVVTLSISQAAREFGRDEETIRKRIVELKIEPHPEKRHGYSVYRLRDLLEIERRGADGEVNPDRLTPFERQAHFKSEWERLRVDTERGELIRRVDAEAEWARVLKLIAQELDTIVDRVERDVGASPLVLEKIESVVDVIRERMYAGVVSIGAMPETSTEPASDAAASAS